MVELFANSGDPDQTPHSAASDLGLHCLPVTRLMVSNLQWLKLVLLDRRLALKSDAAENNKYVELSNPVSKFTIQSPILTPVRTDGRNETVILKRHIT